MLSLDLCARYAGACEWWGRVWCEPSPGEVVRMIALPGERTCVGWCPEDIWQQCLCSAGSSGDCPEWAGCAPIVAYRWCIVVGESIPALPPCERFTPDMGVQARIEAHRRWRSVGCSVFSSSGWHECGR